MSDFATWSTYSYSDLVLGLIQSSDFCTTLTAHSLVTESLEPPEQFVSRGGGTESHDSGFHQGWSSNATTQHFFTYFVLASAF